MYTETIAREIYTILAIKKKIHVIGWIIAITIIPHFI